MVDFEGYREVIRHYTWRGRLQSYRAGNTWIPTDPRNSDYQRLQQAIAAGTCVEVEPEITSARRAMGVHGEVTGYDTNLGYIPHDASNHLFKILMLTVASGRLEIGEPVSHRIAPDEMVDALIVCVLFQRPWAHLTGSLERTFPYKSHGRSSQLDLLVRIHNIPSAAPASAVDTLLREKGIVIRHEFQTALLQAAVLELEVPAQHLLRLFRSEHSVIDEGWAPFLGDQLEQHLARSGRSQSRGPARDWLIAFAGFYLTRFTVSFANLVMRAFTLEWGGIPPGYVDDRVLQSNSVILARLRNGQHRIQGGGFGRQESFGLSGQWPDHSVAVREILDPSANPLGHRRHIPTRVRQMVDAGFVMEAISLLNAFLEVLIRDSILILLRSEPEAMAISWRLGHGARLEVLREVSAAQPRGSFYNDRLGQAVQLSETLYRHRNDYLHDLALPTRESWLTVDAERDIRNLISAFTDPTMGHLRDLAAIQHAPDSIRTSAADTVRRRRIAQQARNQ